MSLFWCGVFSGVLFAFAVIGLTAVAASLLSLRKITREQAFKDAVQTAVTAKSTASRLN